MPLALIDRQIPLVQLQHDQVASCDINGMHLAFPETIGTLLTYNFVIQAIPERFPKLITLTVDHLAVVKISVMPMPERWPS